MTTTHRRATDPSDEATIGRLVADTSRDLSTLIRSEIELAKSELKFSARAGGAGIGLFAGAAFLLLLAIVMISIAFAIALSYLPGINTAAGFAIVFLVYVLIAALLAYIGTRKIKQVKAPEKTIETVKDTKKVFTHGNGNHTSTNG